MDRFDTFENFEELLMETKEKFRVRSDASLTGWRNPSRVVRRAFNSSGFNWKRSMKPSVMRDLILNSWLNRERIVGVMIDVFVLYFSFCICVVLLISSWVWALTFCKERLVDERLFVVRSHFQSLCHIFTTVRHRGNSAVQLIQLFFDHAKAFFELVVQS